MGKRTIFFCDICEMELNSDELHKVPSVNTRWNSDGNGDTEYSFETIECCEYCKTRIAKSILKEKEEIQSKK